MSKPLFVVYYKPFDEFYPRIHGVYDDLKLAEEARKKCSNFEDIQYAHTCENIILNDNPNEDE